LIGVILKRLEMKINKSNTIYFNKSPPGDFTIFPEASIEVPTEKESIVFGFYMINYELTKEKKGIFAMKFNGSLITESKQIASTQCTVMTGAFAVIQQVKSTSLSVLYNVQSDGSVAESKQQSFHFGVIKMPQGSVFKSFFHGNASLVKTNKWSDFPSLNLEISSDNIENSLFVIMYSVSLPLPRKDAEFGTRLRFANKKIPETMIVNKNASYFTAHAAYAVEGVVGTQTASLEYWYNSDAPIEVAKNNAQLYSITAFALPKSAILENCKLEKRLSLSEGEWRNFGFKKTIYIPSQRSKSTILVIYHVSLLVNGRKFSVALSINGKTFKNNVSSSDLTDMANIQGYAVEILPGGEYTFDLKYLLHLRSNPALSTSTISYDPFDKLSNDSVSMQIIILE
jgi:hypothetical protein